MRENENYLGVFFNVVTKKQAYINILYLLLTFPIGIFYFIFMVTGISLGFGLLILVIGGIILYFVVLCSKGFMIFERKFTELMTKMEFEEPQKSDFGNISFFRRILLEIGNPDNWKAVIYLLILKFPLGIINFVITVTMVSLSIGLICAPLVLQNVSYYVEPNIYSIDYFSIFNYLNLELTVFQQSIVCMFLGLILSVITLHIINGLTFTSGKILYYMSPVTRDSTLKADTHIIKDS